MEAVSAAKSRIRSELRTWRRGLPLDDVGRRSELICRELIEITKDLKPSVVMVFDPVRGEPDLGVFRDWLAANGVAITVPEDEPGALVPELIVVPGIAFTAAGHRLGQGGGWYDRFLSGLDREVSTVGVCFLEQVLEVLPQESHDIVVHKVISA